MSPEIFHAMDIVPRFNELYSAGPVLSMKSRACCEIREPDIPRTAIVDVRDAKAPCAATRPLMAGPR
jgi:hypothetical protein